MPSSVCLRSPFEADDSRSHPQADHALVVPGAVVDAVAEALARAATSAARADLIYRLTEELLETVAWLNQADPAAAELISLEGVLGAARSHRHRMDEVTRSSSRMTTAGQRAEGSSR